jgi:hypothetical protein
MPISRDSIHAGEDGGRVIKRMLVRCPVTKRLNVTGLVIEEDSFAGARVKSRIVSCAHCGQKHPWSKKEVILAR